MVLAPDQRAILELLLSRGRTYEQIGETTGLEAEEVRRRARTALAAISGAEPDAELADLLLGRLDRRAQDRARAALQRDRDRSAMAREVAASIRRELGVEPRVEPPPAGTSESRAPRLGFGSLAAASFGLVAAALVLAVWGVPWGADEGLAPAGGDPVEAESLEVVMRAPRGGGGEGRAVIHLGEELEPLLDLELENVPGPGDGELHLLWVERDDGRGVPLATEMAVDGEGEVAQRFALAPELLAIIEASRTIALLRVDREALRDLSRQLEDGPRRGSADDLSLPQRRGQVLLEGRLPRS